MSSSPVRRRLDRSRVVRTAVELADEEGLAAASMRGVAERLGVTPMALYKHIASRSQLIDEMLDQVLDQIPSATHPIGWSETVRARILAARHVLLAHPWARDAIESRELATPTVLAYLDSLMAAMFDDGLSADLVHHAMHALSTRMWGFTRDVLPTPRVPESPEERARVMSDLAMSYPAIVRMATTASHAGAACDDDAEFAFALDLILDGINRLHESGWHPSDTRPEGTPLATRST
ncbi:TetR/AcrR family transcriptional regulator [Propionicimonas sp.]|uniref:TetR/AcrR family transcriptional regulator n=1 Tax=Propionicimonas sp. TaxID=1955623 RepID=UPI0039E4A424